LTRLDAQYLVLLYGLDVKLENKALHRFEKVRNDPELGKEVKKKKKKKRGRTFQEQEQTTESRA